MTLLLHLPVVLSFLLLGAHLMRHFGPVPALLALAPIILLLIPRKVVALIVQTLLVLAALEWLRAAVTAIGERQSRGDDWMRYAIILGAVTLFTLLSLLVFRTKRLRRYYGSAAKQ